ncbi:MAG: Methionine synthase I, cobalamin-binding domain protein, partial [bacterium 42_11]
KEALEKVLPLAKKYGASVIGLTITEKGIPETVEERIKAAYKIIESAASYGIPKEEVIIDPLTMPAGAKDPMITIEAIRKLSKEGIKTILGISNVSHGLPSREILNSAFLAMAISAGLSFAIINPLKRELMETLLASDLLVGKDKRGERFISIVGPQREEKEVKADSLSLKELIIRGETERAAKEAENLINSGEEPFSLIERYVIPGLEDVGDKYERKVYFLPQLIASAEAASSVFEVIKKFSPKSESKKGKIIMATVEGDLHDLGKKIVGLVLESFGYHIIDLGKDVPAEEVLRVSKEVKPDVVGLSCLMTTTLGNMKKTVKLLKESLPKVKVMVGGAAVNEEFAKACGADGYGKDPFQAVELVRKWVKR